MSDTSENPEQDTMPDDDSAVRTPIILFGVTIGSCTGWDSYGDNGMQFFDFIPIDPFIQHIPECENFCVDMNEGKIVAVWGVEDEENFLEEILVISMFLSLLSTAVAGMGK